MMLLQDLMGDNCELEMVSGGCDADCHRRRGTYASKHLEDNVPEEVKVRRLNEIIALQNRLSAESNQRCIGKTYEVLVEGVSKRSRDQLFGRTEQNRVVVFDRGTHRVGDFVNVRVTEASSATLKGEEI